MRVTHKPLDKINEEYLGNKNNFFFMCHSQSPASSYFAKKKISLKWKKRVKARSTLKPTERSNNFSSHEEYRRVAACYSSYYEVPINYYA